MNNNGGIFYVPVFVGSKKFTPAITALRLAPNVGLRDHYGIISYTSAKEGVAAVREYNEKIGKGNRVLKLVPVILKTNYDKKAD